MKASISKSYLRWLCDNCTIDEIIEVLTALAKFGYVTIIDDTQDAPAPSEDSQPQPRPRKRGRGRRVWP